MEDLRFALLVIGGCAIVAILAHGLWSLRKNSSDKDTSSAGARIEPLAQQPEQNRVEGFDEFGLGEVRVVGSNSPESNTSEGDVEDDVKIQAEPQEFDPETIDGYPSIDDVEPQVTSNEAPNVTSDASSEGLTLVEPEDKPEPPQKLYASVVSNPKPVVKREYDKPESYQTSDNQGANTNIPEPPPFLLNPDDVKVEEQQQVEAPETDVEKRDVEEFSLDQAPLNPEPQIDIDANKEVEPAVPEKKTPVRKRSKSLFKRRIEPTIGEDQMSISFDEASPQLDTSAPSTTEQSANSESPQMEQEVLVLNVRAPNDQEIPGAALLPMLLTLGFKFGDQDIFHRHVNSNGKGPVLFSLANMFKPGVFDIDNLENFTTQGISLFMILPIEGDPHQVFNMMHNAARKLAEEFNGQILDGRRSVLTKQGLQQYVEKIREFERQRMISRHD